MAVEDLAGKYVMAPGRLASPRVASFQHFNNPYKALMDIATLPAASSIASTIEVANIKPDAVLSALGFIAFAALGADTTLSLGLKDDASIGLSGKTTMLINAAASASAGTASAIAAVSLANRYKPLWELAGLAEMPRKPFTLVITLGGAASSAGGAVAWELPFTSY